ncbi:hypothetical protein [Emergencia timonensis]|uniref:Uncharacterized protein n=1 Tax=Emergencia timonensis TaxID=1776384 RepID=A0A415E547_9FIRM|nr:hypothetical protein DW099_10160 [Emergencia timonensis]
MAIGHIKVIFQRIPAIFRVEYGNAFAVFIDSTHKFFVPVIKLQNGSSVWALGENQELFVKSAFIIVAGTG